MTREIFTSFKAYRRAQNLIAAEYFAKQKAKRSEFAVSDKYQYILKDRKFWYKNLLTDLVVKYINQQKDTARNGSVAYPIHKYIHHGLSSQAMLFNLFGEPLINNDYAFFQEVFGFADIRIDDRYQLKFEHYNRDTFKEYSQQPTSIDFTVLAKDKDAGLKSIFVEAKYVEAEFGGCSAIKAGECDGLNPVDDHSLCYLTDKKRNYWEIMRKHGLDAAFKNTPICPFTIYYQFYRELMFALENNGYFVMLVDRRNPVFHKQTSKGKIRGLIPVLMNQLPANIQKEISVIYIQDVLPLLEKYGYKWVGEFREKYGM